MDGVNLNVIAEYWTILSLHHSFTPINSLIHSVLPHTKDISLASLQHRFSLMWERKEAKSFDVTTGHAKTTPLPSCLKLFLGRTTDISNFFMILQILLGVVTCINPWHVYKGYGGYSVCVMSLLSIENLSGSKKGNMWSAFDVRISEQSVQQKPNGKNLENTIKSPIALTHVLNGMYS